MRSAVERPATVMGTSAAFPIPEEDEEQVRAFEAKDIKRPTTTEPSMLDALLVGHHRFDGTVWKQLCDSYNRQAVGTRQVIEKQLLHLDREREKARTKEAVAEAVNDLKARTSVQVSRKQKLAAMLRENDATWREKLAERRTRSQRRDTAEDHPLEMKRGPSTPRPGTTSTPRRSMQSGQGPDPPRPGTTGGVPAIARIPFLSEAVPETNYPSSELAASDGFSSVARSTPWGDYRALTDRPSREDHVRRQKMYREMLDQQVMNKRAVQDRAKQANRDLESTTATSLYSPSHEWEQRPKLWTKELDPQMYKRALMHAKAQKEKRERDYLKEEREQYSSWVTTEMERTGATLARQEKKRLAMLDTLVESWDQMVERKAEKKSAMRRDELAQDKHLLGGTFRTAEDRVRLLRKPRPKDVYKMAP